MESEPPSDGDDDELTRGEARKALLMDPVTMLIVVLGSVILPAGVLFGDLYVISMTVDLAVILSVSFLAALYRGYTVISEKME